MTTRQQTLTVILGPLLLCRSQYPLWLELALSFNELPTVRWPHSPQLPPLSFRLLQELLQLDVVSAIGAALTRWPEAGGRA
jgi:hypothetical protein